MRFLDVCFSLLLGFSFVNSSCGLRPNIIFILADDLGVGDLSVDDYKQEQQEHKQQIQTPSLERMARNGIRYTQAYAPSPVCGPSRASILFGYDTGQSPIRGNTGTGIDFDLPRSETTFVELLESSGYFTALIGKWGFGGPGGSLPGQYGFQRFIGQLTHQDAHVLMPLRIHNHTKIYPFKLNKKNQNNFNFMYTIDEQSIYLEKNEKANENYCIQDNLNCDFAHDVYTRYALDYISDHCGKNQKNNNNNNNNQPYFLYLSYNTPHVGSWLNEDKLDNYRDKIRKVAPKYDKNCVDTINVPGDTSKVDECRHKSILEDYIDVDVGKILDLVRDCNDEDSTMIIFAGDNGPNGNLFLSNNQRNRVHHLDTFYSTAGMRGGKRDMYEGGIRTPLIIQWKNTIPMNSVSTKMVSLIDLYQTFIEVAGLTEQCFLFPPSLSSRILSSLSSSSSSSRISSSRISLLNNENEHDYLYWEFCPSQVKEWKTIRRRPWKRCSRAARLQNGMKLVYRHETEKLELYNITNDYSETRNIININENSILLKQLQDIFDNSHVPLTGPFPEMKL